MSSKLHRLLLFLLSFLLIVCVLAVAVGASLPSRSFPQTSGVIRLDGLNGTVDIYRDVYGIPQIYASSPHDLFFAQGYVHTQDRFWQMDFWRHIGSGNLSEMFGSAQLDTDKFLRTLGWGRVAQQELKGMDADTLAILQAYADGVNAYLKDHQGAALSLEYVILKLLTPGYQPAPWTPLNSLTWAKVMAWDLGGNLDSEIRNAILLKTLSPAQLADLFPPYPSDHPVIVPSASAEVLPSPANSAGSLSALPQGQYTALFTSMLSKSAALDALLGPRGAGIGSNNWVISGKLTATGKPLLANDPHLAAQMPSIWYEIGLHCVNKSDACPYEVTGFSFAGAPGVVIGHNDRIAWGFTNVGPDVEDLFIEKINPANLDQYEVDGKWVDMQIVNETVQVAGKSPVSLKVRYTRHGPIISDTYGDLKDFNQKARADLPEPYAISLRWTALDPSNTFTAIWKFDRAQNWDDFRLAAQSFDVPSQNLVYADVDGNIGYQTPGKVPIRLSGDGRFPVPGWTDEHEWQGFIPFDKLPFTYNPAQGYVATANNAVVDASYPNLISTEWDYGYRARRIVDLIEHTPGSIDIAYIQKIQGDDMDLNAQTLVPVLLQIPLQDSSLEKARAILQNWDFQDRMDSAPAALYNVFWNRLMADTFRNKLPEAYWPVGGDQWFEVMRHLVQKPDSPWWGDSLSSTTGNRDQVFAKAFKEAVDEIDKAQGTDPAKWSWGGLHTLTTINQSLGKSGVAPIEALFNRGPYPTSGGGSIVNATAWDATKDYTVRWLPSMRMIVDLSNLQNSLTVNLTGESGHAYNPHYADMTDLWRNIQYHPMLWDQSVIQAAPGGHLQLTP